MTSDTSEDQTGAKVEEKQPIVIQIFMQGTRAYETPRIRTTVTEVDQKAVNQKVMNLCECDCGSLVGSGGGR